MKDERSTVSMDRPLRLLSIGAHPADVFDQSGGTMAHHAGRGDYVACIVVTHGARVHDAVISEEMSHRDTIPDAEDLVKLMAERSDVKTEEVRAAGRILGFEDIYFLGEDDAVLLLTDAVVRKVARLIRRIRPDIVLTHFPKEGDGTTNAHAVAGQIAVYATGLAGGVDPGDTNRPHRTTRTFFFGTGAANVPNSVWGSEGGYYNDVFIDITDVVDKKLAALDALVSQGYGGAYARKRIETVDGAFGNAGGVAYAEGFISQSAQTYDYLPLSEHTIRRAARSDHENIPISSYRIPVD
jgi:LmbE family N-acetylglucosaminyl deacetylase